MQPCGAQLLALGEREPDARRSSRGRRRSRRGSRAALYSRVPSVISTTRPPGRRISSGSAKWLVTRCVSTRQAQHPQPVVEVVLPDRLVPLEQPLAAPDVVDEHVEPAAARRRSARTSASTCSARGGRRRRRCPCRRRPSRARRSPRSSRAGRTRSALARRAPGAVDGRARLAERDRDAAAGAAGGAGDERDLALERVVMALTPLPSRVGGDRALGDRHGVRTTSTASSTSAPPASCAGAERPAEHERTRAPR